MSLLRRFLSIPEDVRADLVEVVERTRTQFEFNQADLSYLFEVYNRYLAPADEPEKITCGGCRTKVVGWFRRAVTEYLTENGRRNDERRAAENADAGAVEYRVQANANAQVRT